MIAELSGNIAGWEKIQGAMDEIRACHDQTTRFFAGVYEELDSLGAALLAREKLGDKQSALRENAIAAADAAADNRCNELIKRLAEERAENSRSQQAVQEQLEKEARF